MLLRFISWLCKKGEPAIELKGAFLAYLHKFLSIYKLFLDRQPQSFAYIPPILDIAPLMLFILQVSRESLWLR